MSEYIQQPSYRVSEIKDIKIDYCLDFANRAVSGWKTRAAVYLRLVMGLNGQVCVSGVPSAVL